MSEHVRKEGLEESKLLVRKLEDRLNELEKCLNGEINPEILKAGRDIVKPFVSVKPESDSYEGDLSELGADGNHYVGTAIRLILQSAKKSGHELGKSIVPSMKHMIGKESTKSYNLIVALSNVLLTLEEGGIGSYNGEEHSKRKLKFLSTFSKLYRLEDRSIYEELLPFANDKDLGSKKNKYEKIHEIHTNFYIRLTGLKSKK
ncbi:MAG: hypothetical protein KAW40_00940 [Candidatus Aenigmarchaeota archaeon]|nr:hypothetical protein [Candidatus Aenigmarchaeota archaeon]